jgi:hypothetical protein
MIRRNYRAESQPMKPLSLTTQSPLTFIQVHYRGAVEKFMLLMTYLRQMRFVNPTE